MYPAIQNIDNKMRQQLEDLNNITDPLLKVKKAVGILGPILQELRSLIKGIDKTDERTAITVYKEAIPPVYAEFIYYASLHNILIAKPFGAREKEYYIKETERIESWFSEHEIFLRYLRSRQTHFDKEYFLPGVGLVENYIDLYSPFVEDSFCPRYSFIAAMGIAYGRLQKDLTLLILRSSSSVSVVSLHWTLSKTDLTELIYALYACGAFNKGKATIKEITRFFEETLQIQLGNTSVTFQEILRRKETIVFLNTLRDRFDNYINQVEEKNIR